MNNQTKPERHAIVTFINSVGHQAHKSLAVGSTCDSIVPAQLLPDCDWVACDKGQRADGLGIVRSVRDGVKSRAVRFFVPFANVADLSYQE